MRFGRALLAALCLVPPQPTSAAALAFVVNSNDASISVLDIASRRELRRIPMLREPHHLVLSPDHRSLVVGDTTGNCLFFLDPHDGAVQRRVAISDPYQFRYSDDGRFLVVAGLARNQIDLYDAATLRLLHRVPAPSMPSHIAYSPDSSLVFVSLQGTDRLMAIQTATGQVIWNSKVGRAPAGVYWNHGQLLVGIMGESHIAVVDPVDGRVVRQVETGRGAHTLFASPDRRVIYVTNRVDGTISVLDPGSLAVSRTLRVPGGPDDLEFAPDGMIWAGLRFAQSVGIVDPERGEVARIPVGRSPHGIWMNTHDTLR